MRQVQEQQQQQHIPERRASNETESRGYDSADDIYSTPNDSIQSVPWALRQPSQQQQQQQHDSNSSYQQQLRITKSFSTNSFAQLATQPNQPQTALPSFRRQNSNESSQSNQQQQQQQHMPPKSSASGSRFFIPSSSSEDSTGAHQQQQQNNIVATASRLAANEPLDEEPAQQQHQQPSQIDSSSTIVQRELALRHGVHYHASQRPESLLLADSCRTVQNNSVSLFTPTSGLGLISSHTQTGAYRRSPSLFEMSAHRNGRLPLTTSFKPTGGPAAAPAPSAGGQPTRLFGAQKRISNSISLYDYKQLEQQQQQLSKRQMYLRRSRADLDEVADENKQQQVQPNEHNRNNGDDDAEYKLAHMMLECGSNPDARDIEGNTALMHAVASDNLAAMKCLLERGAKPDDLNAIGQSPLDMLCAKAANPVRLDMVSTSEFGGAHTPND